MTKNKGFVCWFTGLSGAGKTTLSTKLADELRARGLRVEILDGDEVRTKALAGELPGFTGVSDPYEEPFHPEVVVETDREEIDVSAAKILNALAARHLVPQDTVVLDKPLSHDPVGVL